MNIFRLTGDLSHLLAIIILLVKILKTRSCAGISGKSQILFTIVYITRYLDLFTTFISVYNVMMKVIFIVVSMTTVLLIFIFFRKTYDRGNDSFRIELLLSMAALLALYVNHEFSALEVLWTFSIYLEAVAILPQLFMISETGEAESITCHYLFALGSYRAFYLINWIYRYTMESHYDLIAICAGVVQTILYWKFFYLYVTKVLRGKKLKLSDNLSKEEKRVFDQLRNEIYQEFREDAVVSEKDDQPTEKIPSNVVQDQKYSAVPQMDI